MKQRNLRRVLVGLACLGLALLTILPSDAAFAGEEEDAKSFVQSVAAMVYGLAWPTATYESFSLKSVDRVRGGYDARVKLNGISAFSGGDLWMEIVFEVRNGSLHDVRVARHNAILSAPFATAEAMGQLVASLLEESSGPSPAPGYYAPGSGSSSNSQGSRLHVANNCRHPIKVAVNYRKLDGSWQTVGWWNFDGGSSSYLAASNGELLRTRNSIFYYYAEAQSGDFYWNSGKHQFTVDGQKVLMVRKEDTYGDAEISLSCPGR